MNDNLRSWLLEAGLGGESGLRALAYGVAAMGCAMLGTARGLALRTPRALQRLWLPLCGMYLLLAASALVQGDVLWVGWMRDLAREQHAYEWRRLLQLGMLLAVLLLAVAGWKKLRLACDLLSLRTLLLAGVCGTLALHVLRYVSFHYSDLALNAVWLGHSVATWFECGCLALAGTGTGMELLRSHGHV